jgi:hypothetical protein
MWSLAGSLGPRGELGYRTASVSKIANGLCKYIMFVMFDWFGLML